MVAVTQLLVSQVLELRLYLVNKIYLNLNYPGVSGKILETYVASRLMDMTQGRADVHLKRKYFLHSGEKITLLKFFTTPPIAGFVLTPPPQFEGCIFTPPF